MKRTIIAAPSTAMAIIPPLATSVSNASAATAWYAVNRMTLMRFTVQTTTVIQRATLGCGTASGNIEVPIYKVTRTGVRAFNLTKVGGSGAIACPTPTSSSIDVPFTADLSLTPGGYAVGLWCDNTTATFVHSSANGFQWSGLSLSDVSANAGGAAASITGAGHSSRGFGIVLEGAI